MDTHAPLTTATALTLLPEWELAMTAENKSPLTVKVYTGAVRQYLGWTAIQHSAPFELGTLNRWVADALASGLSGATARTRQLAVRRYAAWLLVTGHLGDDPFRGIKTPKVEPPLVQPLTNDELRALIATCDVADDAPPDLLLQHRRDEAIIRLMLETAIRKGEVAGLEYGDVDLDAGLITVRRGKGGRGRVIPIGPFANRALRAYCSCAPNTPWSRHLIFGSAHAVARWATRGSTTPCAAAPNGPVSTASALTGYATLPPTAGSPRAAPRPDSWRSPAGPAPTC